MQPSKFGEKTQKENNPQNTKHASTQTDIKSETSPTKAPTQPNPTQHPNQYSKNNTQNNNNSIKNTASIKSTTTPTTPTTESTQLEILREKLRKSNSTAQETETKLEFLRNTIKVRHSRREIPPLGLEVTYNEVFSTFTNQRKRGGCVLVRFNPRTRETVGFSGAIGPQIQSKLIAPV